MSRNALHIYPDRRCYVEIPDTTEGIPTTYAQRIYRTMVEGMRRVASLADAKGIVITSVRPRVYQDRVRFTASGTAI